MRDVELFPALSRRLRSPREVTPSSLRSESERSGSRSGVTSCAMNSPAYLPSPWHRSQVWMLVIVGGYVDVGTEYLAPEWHDPCQACRSVRCST